MLALLVLKSASVAAETIHFGKDVVELICLAQVLGVASDLVRSRLIANCSRF